MNTQSVPPGKIHINPVTGKPVYYKDNKVTHDKNNARQMHVAGKYISKRSPLHKPGRYRNWNDAHSHKVLDTVMAGHVYVLHNPSWPEWFKVGMAVDVNDRVSSLQTGCPFRNYEAITHIKTSNKRALENKAHTLFEAHAEERRGEWFKVSYSTAQHLMQQVKEMNIWK